MSRLSILLALVFASFFASISEAQLFPRIRRARDEARRATDRSLEREQKAREQEEKKRDNIQQRLDKKVDKANRSNRNRLSPQTPTEAPKQAPQQFTRPRAASGLEVQASQRADSTISQIYYLDQRGNAQLTTGTIDASKQYYKRQRSVVGRDGRPYLVLEKLTRQELTQFIASRKTLMAPVAGTGVANRPAATSPRPTVATTTFEQPIINGPLPQSAIPQNNKPTIATDSSSSILGPTPVKKAPIISSPVVPSVKQTQTGNDAVPKSILERVDDDKNKND